MAHTDCPSGHSMWNGDGKPVVEAYRIGFFEEYEKEHPGFILGQDEKCWAMYDCTEDVPGEDLDCWYCDICQGLTVFVDNYRYDYKRMEVLPQADIEDVLLWEEYIAMSDRESEEFQDYYEGKSPMEAINTYGFKYKYRVSPDKKTIYAINQNSKIEYGYQQSEYYKFS